LCTWETANFKDPSVLINNAGLSDVDFKKGTEDLVRHRTEDGEDETDTNLESLVYMTALFTLHQMKQKETAIMNVSSELMFHMMPIVPVYCETKEEVHMFSILLRQQMESTSVKYSSSSLQW
jgi:uncharacterized oxidoreductase